ncbi:MAG: hypothetical protein JNN26_14940 [Candidatus Obscuribacter sp.]|nr:hypothetical protein [Candidatus Obscuribacter sp.]
MSQHAKELLLERVARAHFQYFLDYQDKDTGLILDRTREGGPATIAGVGFALPAYAAASRRHWISRGEAVSYTLKVLRLLWTVPQGEEAQGKSGYRGYFYHFLDPKTGERATAPRFWNSELSSIDTALLMAGVRFAAAFYAGQTPEETEIRQLADQLYNRVQWNWLLRPDGLIGHGWSPEQGMIESVYSGYSEALLLYLLALGSPTHAVPSQSWQALCRRYQTANYTGKKKGTFITMPGTPLFCYQFPHCFVDFRGIKDGVNRKLGFDYFENSRRATLAQHRYAVLNPENFLGYDHKNWGLTASDGPGDRTATVNGKERCFSWYRERGAPFGHDDGTIAPTAAMSSLPFAPGLVIKTARHWLKHRPELFSRHGFADAFNDSFTISASPGETASATCTWVDPERIAIDQGPVVLMFENHRSGLIWRTMRRDPVLQRALEKADFRGGWLKKKAKAARAAEAKTASSRKKH